MLPPVLEIHVLWHPKDVGGEKVAAEIIEHFHGTLFSGLIGGAIEVYTRSAGWRSVDDAPRPIPFTDQSISPHLSAAEFVAVVPIMGNEMAFAGDDTRSAWSTFLTEIRAARDAAPRRVAIVPYLLDRDGMSGTVGKLFGTFQRIGANPASDGETAAQARCRELAQSISRLVSGTDDKLTAFISHTKRNSVVEGESVAALIGLVRSVIKDTRLEEFFDASDLQPGENWDDELRRKSGSSALLAIRTDLYPTREWCQREIRIAKQEGMPVIFMDALGDAEERGSFLMDHAPRVPARVHDGQWRRRDIHRALSLLVDECAKRALWHRQRALAERDGSIKVSWWAPHAPEPITLTSWLQTARQQNRLPANGESLVILHPDPPLGPEEKAALQDILNLAGFGLTLDAMTPRQLAARGG